MGNPKKHAALSNNNKSGIFNAKSKSIESIINFCSCRFFMELKIYNLNNKIDEIVYKLNY